MQPIKEFFGLQDNSSLKKELLDFQHHGKIKAGHLRIRSNEAIKQNKATLEQIEKLEQKVYQAYGEALQAINQPKFNRKFHLKQIEASKKEWHTFLKTLNC